MLYDGMIIKGLWYGNTYRVHKELGRGAIGIVYLVENLQTLQLCAMKISQSLQMTSGEYVRLKTIQQEVQSGHFGPLLYEMDDLQIHGQQYHYYTMEYIHGQTLERVLRISRGGKRARRRQLRYIGQILSYLQAIHQKGYVFADVKAENIMLEYSQDRIRFIDFGGVVAVGKMVKQYSALYDRGCWKMGGRKADYRYDLFAVGILLVQIFVPHGVLLKAQKSANPMDVLYDIIHRELPLYLRPICIKAFCGQYRTTGEMCREVQNAERHGGRRFWRLSKIDCAFWGSLVFMLSTVIYIMVMTK